MPAIERIPVRAVFGVISLLLVVAIVGFVAGRQLKGLRNPPTAAASAAGIAAPPPAETPKAQVQRAGDDVKKALEQGAARSGEADK
jgi:hypothetical protein